MGFISLCIFHCFFPFCFPFSFFHFFYSIFHNFFFLYCSTASSTSFPPIFPLWLFSALPLRRYRVSHAFERPLQALPFTIKLSTDSHAHRAHSVSNIPFMCCLWPPLASLCSKARATRAVGSISVHFSIVWIFIIRYSIGILSVQFFVIGLLNEAHSILLCCSTQFSHIPSNVSTYYKQSDSTVFDICWWGDRPPQFQVDCIGFEII